MSKNPIYLKNNKIYSTDPFFFYNDKIDPDYVYITQDIKTVYQGLYIIDIWNKKRLNVTNEAEFGYDLPFNLYIYNSQHNIILKKIKGGNEKYKIIVYKKNNILFYLALLQYKKKVI